MKDLPFDKALAEAEAFIRQGANVHQKFTCGGCGTRLTIEAPNSFHRTGTCDRCDHVTEITACGFLLHFGAKR